MVVACEIDLMASARMTDGSAMMRMKVGQLDASQVRATSLCHFKSASRRSRDLVVWRNSDVARRPNSIEYGMYHEASKGGKYYNRIVYL